MKRRDVVVSYILMYMHKQKMSSRVSIVVEVPFAYKYNAMQQIFCRTEYGIRRYNDYEVIMS